MKKRTLTLILAAILCLSVVGCVSNEPVDDDELTEEIENDDRESETDETEDVTETSAEEDSDELSEDTSAEIPDDTTAEPETDVSDEPIDGSTPLLYKVMDADGDVVWLFGSIHVGREDYYPLPDYVMDAFEGSDALAVECDIISFETDVDAQVEALMQYLYVDGTTVRDHISTSLYLSAASVLDGHGYYDEVLDYYSPALWVDFINTCTYELLELDTENGVDMHLMRLAEEKGKKLVEVESVAFQYGMMAGFSEELQIYLLEGAIADYARIDELDEEINLMMDLWVAGDEKAFAEYLDMEIEFESEDEKRLYEEYTKAMEDDRNVTMTEFAVQALESGDEMFICVGAAHVVGEGGMAEMLREAGYTVEIVR